MSLLKTIIPFKSPDLSQFIKVYVGEQQIGWTPVEFSKQISSFNDVWYLGPKGLELNATLNGFDERTKAIDETFMALSNAGILPPMPDYSAFGGIDWFPAHTNENPLFIVKRFYSPCLGIKINSVMLNGYNDQGYWVAKRGTSVDTAPGKLDLITAGALRYQETVFEGLLHEGSDEAGLDEQDLKNAVFTGTLHLPNIHSKGFFTNETFHVFDLDLKDKTPETKLEVEVDGFSLIPFDQLVDILETGSIFKEHIHLVVIDFIIRHGHLTDTHPEYHAVKKLLHQTNTY